MVHGKYLAAFQGTSDDVTENTEFLLLSNSLKLWIQYFSVSSPASVPGGGSKVLDARRWWQRRSDDDRWGRRQIIAVVANFFFRSHLSFYCSLTCSLHSPFVCSISLFTSSSFCTSLYITAASHRPFQNHTSLSLSFHLSEAGRVLMKGGLMWPLNWVR